MREMRRRDDGVNGLAVRDDGFEASILNGLPSNLIIFHLRKLLYEGSYYFERAKLMIYLSSLNRRGNYILVNFYFIYWTMDDSSLSVFIKGIIGNFSGSKKSRDVNGFYLGIFILALDTFMA